MNSDFNVAVHALVYLQHKACTLSSEELAENICTNAARVRKVMSKLRRAGMVKSAEGAVGGYALEQPTNTITLAAIADAIDCSFVGSSWQSGDTEMECLVSSGMGDIMDGIYRDLDQLCRKRLRGITIDDIHWEIFGKKEK